MFVIGEYKNKKNLFYSLYLYILQFINRFYYLPQQKARMEVILYGSKDLY